MGVRKKVSYSALLGVVVSNRRQRRQIEQGDMAARMGLSQASFSRLESGKATFNVEQLFMAASILDAEPEQLLSDTKNYARHLEREHIQVQPQLRGNASGSRDDVAGFVAGAALGALLMGVLAKK